MDFGWILGEFWMDFGWILEGFGEEFWNNLRSHSFLNKVCAYLRTTAIFLQLHKKHEKNLGFFSVG